MIGGPAASQSPSGQWLIALGPHRGRDAIAHRSASVQRECRTIIEQLKTAPNLECRDPALAIGCIHKQPSHIPSTLATKSQKSRWNVLDVNADAVPGQRVRRVDRGDGQL